MSPSDGLFQPAGGPPLSMTPLGASPHHLVFFLDGFMNGTLGNTYELIRRSSTATKLLIPQHHQSTCASQCSIPFNPLTVPTITGAEVIEFHLRSSSAWQAKTSITCYWGNDWLIERIQTQNHQLVYTAPENWLLIHHFGNDWGYIQDDASGLQESPVFFFMLSVQVELLFLMVTPPSP